MSRGYQFNFSEGNQYMFDVEGRQRKAETMVHVLSEFIEQPLKQLVLLNVGGSAGIIDEYLSRYFGHVIGMDIDRGAIEFAQANFQKKGLFFEVGDACDMQFESEKFDVVVCSQVYEHVPDAQALMAEMLRVLKPGGVVYFAAGNRLMINEPHYDLPLLSWLPRPLAHFYVRTAGRGEFYYEKHLTYWNLKRLVSDFNMVDYTPKILAEPARYRVEYMVRPGTNKHKIANFMAKNMVWLVPGYIWLLVKPSR